jgi:hypothetical protein
MGDYWILCGLLERYLRLLPQAGPALPALPAPSITQRFPLAARILPGRRA